MSRAHAVPETACPGCGHELELATGLGHSKKPQPGDVTVCIRCALTLIFGPGLTLRRATTDEIDALAPEARSLVDRARWFIHGRKPS